MRDNLDYKGILECINAQQRTHFKLQPRSKRALRILVTYTMAIAYVVAFITISLYKSTFLIAFLIELKLFTFLTSLLNFDHKSGTIYLIECFPYLTMLKRGNLKSEVLNLYVLESALLQNMS